MSDTATATPAPDRSFVQNLIDVYIAPRDAFTALVRKPGFWLALALYVVLLVVFTAVWLQKVDPGEFFKNQMIESGQWDKMPAENRAQALEAQAKFLPIFAWLGAFLFWPLILLAIAGIFTFIYRFFYAAEVAFKQSMTIVTYSTLAYGLVTTPLLLLILHLKGDWNLNPQEVLQANATLLLDRESVSKPLWALVGSLDLLTFWALWLLATGFAVASKRSTGSALWGVVVPWALIVCAKVAIAWMTAS
jgi:hypothetical protein